MHPYASRQVLKGDIVFLQFKAGPTREDIPLCLKEGFEWGHCIFMLQSKSNYR